MLGMIATAAVATPLATVLILASRKPDSFRIERSTTIDAPPAKVLEWIDDFRRWVDWSPWEELDPELKRTFSGPERGKGAVYEWLGNKRAGAGRMEVIEVTDGSKVEIKLDFIAPFEAHNFAEF
ncbi:MAG: SRPBCC family protein, partial [Polyangiaceae bacterium]|nr:SRPBCC family protein [Polyangiaceae bacterium]